MGVPPLHQGILGGTLTGSNIGSSSLRRSSGARSSRGSGGFGDPDRRVTDTLLVVNAVLFGLQVLTRQALTVWGLKVNSLILAGQYWRLLTPAFLHGDIIHLAVNSSSLNSLGPLLEQTSGHGRFLTVYLLAGLAGTVGSFFGSPNPSLGASGAIFGVGGALAVYFYRHRDIYGTRSDFILKQLWQSLLINLTYGAFNSRIDNWGHICGMLGGALAALLLGPSYRVGKLPGQKGSFLLDRPPLPLLSNKPRQIKG